MKIQSYEKNHQSVVTQRRVLLFRLRTQQRSRRKNGILRRRRRCGKHLETKYQGWINTLHVGIQAVLLYEICAWVILRKLQTTGVTSKMETRYMKSIETTDPYVTLRARIVEQKRNIIILEATINNCKGELCTKAICTYFTFAPEKARSEMQFLGCETDNEEINPRP